MSDDLRKKHLTYLITESIKILKEQQVGPAMQAMPPPAPQPQSPVPPSTGLPGQQQPGMDPTQQQAQQPAPPVEFTLDQMIEMLNIVRGGKSFSDPEVYGKLTSFFKGLTDSDKEVLNRVLQTLSGMMSQTQVDGGAGQASGPPQSEPAPVQASPMMGAPVAAPPQMEESSTNGKVSS